MNITILIKLLEAHAKKPGAGSGVSTGGGGNASSSSSLGGVPPGKGSPIGVGGASSIKPLVSQKVVGLGGSAVSIQGNTKTLQVTTPGLRLPPGVKTKTVLARVQPQHMRHMTSTGSHKAQTASILSKKLPIWKERKYSPASQGGSSESMHMDK